MTTFSGKLSIDQVARSLDAFKASVYNVSYINNLIDANKGRINTNTQFVNGVMTVNGYSAVLTPLVVSKFPNNDVNN